MKQAYRTAAAKSSRAGNEESKVNERLLDTLIRTKVLSYSENDTFFRGEQTDTKAKFVVQAVVRTLMYGENSMSFATSSTKVRLRLSIMNSVQGRSMRREVGWRP